MAYVREMHDDIYTVEEFKIMVKHGVLIDYDGFGYPMKDGLADDEILVYPSRVDDIPEDATHVVWFNR